MTPPSFSTNSRSLAPPGMSRSTDGAYPRTSAAALNVPGRSPSISNRPSEVVVALPHDTQLPPLNTCTLAPSTGAPAGSRTIPERDTLSATGGPSDPPSIVTDDRRPTRTHTASTPAGTPQRGIDPTGMPSRMSWTRATNPERDANPAATGNDMLRSFVFWISSVNARAYTTGAPVCSTTRPSH